MKSFTAFNQEDISEAKIKEEGDMIVVQVPKGVADEIQMATFETSDTDYGEKKGNKIHLYKKEIKSLIDRWEVDYHKDHGLEEVKPAIKRKILELAKMLKSYA